MKKKDTAVQFFTGGDEKLINSSGMSEINFLFLLNLGLYAESLMLKKK